MMPDRASIQKVNRVGNYRGKSLYKGYATQTLDRG